jgi:hypothetical protein
MKKLLSLLLVLALILTCVACGTKNNGNSDSGTDVVDNGNENNENENENDDNNEENEDDKNDITMKEIFIKFLKGESKAIANEDIEGLQPGEEYTIDELGSTFKVIVGIDYRLDVLDKIQVGNIDAGDDKDEELAIKFTYTNSDGSDSAEVMTVLKNVDGKLHVLIRTDSYYRTASAILQNGVVTYGGSNSAFEHSMEYKYIDKDGKVNYIVGIETVYGLTRCVIPAGYLSEAISGSDFPTVPELCDGEPKYIMHMVRTAPYNYANYDIREYDEYSREHLFYIFTNIDENEYYEADEEYAAYYKNKEVNVVAPEKAPNFFDSCFAAYGLDTTAMQCPEVMWQDLEK